LKTQQADSLGRDAVLRRPRTGPGKGVFSLWLNSRTAQRAVPTIWLNLVCLDAPLVAAAWLWLFARTFGVPFQVGNAVALFLTAWLIYLADRFADASSLNPNLPRSLRQDFCLRHREIWIAVIVLVAGFDAYVIWRTTALQTLVVGAVVGGLAVVYLVVNHPLGRIWRSLPAKELAIGILFAAGTVVALLPLAGLTPTFGVAVVAFAALCSLNCISIAAWEGDLDREQGKVSIATLHPAVIGRVGQLCAGLAAVSLVFAFFFLSAAMFFACVSISALLLTYLNASPKLGSVVATVRQLPDRRRHAFGRRQSAVAPTNDQRTALADLALLTPLVLMIASAL
jgi:hypothetical protein